MLRGKRMLITYYWDAFLSLWVRINGTYERDMADINNQLLSPPLFINVALILTQELFLGLRRSPKQDPFQLF